MLLHIYNIYVIISRTIVFDIICILYTLNAFCLHFLSNFCKKIKKTLKIILLIKLVDLDQSSPQHLCIYETKFTP